MGGSRGAAGSSEWPVVIAGAGPTGLMLAGELTRCGVEVVIVERRVDQELDSSRAGGLHSRTIEVFDQRGIAERFLAEGQIMQVAGFAGNPLDISDFPTRHPYGLALWQRHIERILAGWVEEIGVPIRRGCEVIGFVEDGSGVDVELSDGGSLHAGYLVGCDGGRSSVRKTAGIDFVGLDASTSWMIAEVEMDGEPELGFRHDESGTHALGQRPGEHIGVVIMEREVHVDDPDLDELRAAIVGVWGTDFGLRRAHWISRFTDMSRQAATYRRGRVLVAGDAAHIHPPQGGQGLNVGVQDAVNLGWKLAHVVRGTSPDSLLDTYHAERHPVGAVVLQNTQAQIALARPDARHESLRGTMARLLAMDEPRREIAAMMSGLDIHYDLGEGHPLLGRRMPDLDLRTAAGPTRVAELLREARPLLLNLGEPGAADAGPWADRVRSVDAAAAATGWALPVIGDIEPVAAVLIRPDGHVAWTGEPGDPSLPVALTTWCGPAPAGQTGASSRSWS